MIATKQKTITIAIDGGNYVPFTNPENGTQRLVASTLFQIEKEKDTKNRFDYYYFAYGREKQKTKYIHTHQLPTRFFSTFFLPVSAVLNKTSVFIGCSGVLPPLVRIMKLRSVICIHDFGFIQHPENYHNPIGMKWQTEYSLYGADKIIVFSKYVLNQIKTLYPQIPEKKIVHIYPGIDHLNISYSSKKIHLRKPFFLFVGVIKKTKNLEKLFSLFYEYQTKTRDKNAMLYLIGKIQIPYWDTLQKNAVYKKIMDNVRIISYVSDDELIVYYENASALLNVSHDEGFCYPVVEALSRHTPVLVNTLPLYDEFKTYFPHLFILKKNSDFIVKMKEAIDGKLRLKKEKLAHPFRWRFFTLRLLEVIRNVKQ